MNAKVDDSCIGCGLCVDACPEVFAMDDDTDKAVVIADPVPESAQDGCREAAAGCPVDAITLQE